MTKRERERYIITFLCLADGWETSMDWEKRGRPVDDADTEPMPAGLREVVAANYKGIRLEHSLIARKYAEAAALLLDGWDPGDPVEAR